MDIKMDFAKNNLTERQKTFSLLFGHPDLVRYEQYSCTDALLTKIKLLYGEGEFKHFDAVIENLWKQRKYAGFSYLLMSPIVIHMIRDVNVEKGISMTQDIQSNAFSQHLIFRVQKCCNPNAKDCCAIFVDELGRVYEDWDDLLESNRFGEGLMLTPRNGVYRLDSTGNPDLVLITQGKSIMAIVDRVAIGLGFVSIAALGVTCLPIVAGAAVVAEGIAIGASVLGFSTTLYGGGRSIAGLIDRSKHEQTLSLADKEARGAWLNISIASLSTVAMASRAFMRIAASTGRGQQFIKENPKIMQGMQTTMDHTQMVLVGAAGIASIDSIIGIIDALRMGETITVEEIRNLSSALYVLTNSVHNLTFASEIASGMRNSLEGFCPPGIIERGDFIVREISSIGVFTKIGSKLIDKIMPYVMQWVRESRNVADFELLLLDIAETLTLNIFKSFMNFVQNFIGRFLQDIINRFGPRYIEVLTRLLFNFVSAESKKSNMTPRQFISREFLQKYGQSIEEQFKAYIHQKKTERKETILTFEYFNEMLADLELLKSHAVYDRQQIAETLNLLRHSLTVDAIQSLITIVKRFIEARALDIQAKLQRSLDMVTIINDFSRELNKETDDTHFDQYLVDFDHLKYDVIDKKMLAFYEGLLVGENVQECKKCGGQYYNAMKNN